MIELLASALCWRIRGILGWPFTLLFALIQAWTLWPVAGAWSLLFSAWIVAGEPSGWKPKVILDRGDWWRAALLGARIGLIGAVAMPLSTWLHQRFGEPPFLNNPRLFTLPFWTEPKRLLDWRGSWNEMYFGVIFSALLNLIVSLA